MDWYEEEVHQLIDKRDLLPYKPLTAFYGSSSIRLWDSLYDNFAAWLPVNLGFGGSTLEACAYYFDWIVKPVSTAQKIIVYAGDNDLGDGRTPYETLVFFRQLRGLILENFPGVSCYYISIKPSPSRWNIDENIRLTNALIKDEIEGSDAPLLFIDIYEAMLDTSGQPNADYYEEDGLHLSPKGYEVWKDVLLAQIFAA